MKVRLLVLAAIFSVLPLANANAAVVLFELRGNGGVGLLGSNENPIVNGGGSGGEIGAGISFDDVTNILSINVGWGSGNGFTDLTGDVTGIHIHDAGSANFSNNGGVEINVGASSDFTFNNSATNGTLIGATTLSDAQEIELLNGQYYLNVHTATNVGGEIRGNFVAVPEPTSAGLACVALLGSVLVRRRRV